MTQPIPICPYLGLANDRTLVRSAADRAHRCYAQPPGAAPDLDYQAAACLSPAHTDCPFYQAPVQPPPPPARKRRDRTALLPWAALAALFVVVVVVYLLDLRRPTPAATPAGADVAAAPTGVAETATALPAATADQPTPTRFATPTAEPGGRTLTLAPKAGEAGWWSSGDARGNHLGDSFLYAGYTAGQAFVSAVRFDLGQAPRGAAIRSATLRLMGLKADRFAPAAGGTWTVHLLPGNALPDFTRADFQALFNAPAAVTLFPTLFPADLAVGETNTLVLDAAAQAWLAEQIAAGAPAIIARIVGPGGGDTLFAWDSGAGPATAGEAPQLVISFGPPPATPPPLPTEAVIVATLTPTPANILTVAAAAWTATAVAQTTGTATPLPYRVITPTPSPINLATVQARALLLGLPPVVPYTPTPANEATAIWEAAYATAQAFLTGTPTPRPTGAVTPVVIIPTATPENVLTLVAHILQATADAAEFGTPTPWPHNAVLATPTPPWLVILPPANAATAQAQAAYATAVAQVFGTYTPLPPNAATPTPAGYVAPRPTATPTPPLPAACPDPRAQIAAPGPGQVVGRTVIVSGTAAGPYRLAYAVGGSLNYVEFMRGEQPVAGRRLGVLDAAALPPGPYTLQLTVSGAGGDAATCTVVIAIQGP